MVIVWLRTPLAAILMILLLIALFYHTALGLQVVIEDYVHSATKFAAVIAVRLGCCALAGAGVVAILRIALGGREVRCASSKTLRMRLAQPIQPRWIKRMLGHSGEEQAWRQCDVRGEIIARGA
jgi:succinate dehydrogenase/fumarate reductase transmembrane subunit